MRKRNITKSEISERYKEMLQLGRLANYKIAEFAKNTRLTSMFDKSTAIGKVLSTFMDKTDIPLILPFTSLLAIVSTMLLDKHVKLNLKGTIVKPNLWIITLCNSGGGKSFSHSTITKAIKDSGFDIRNFPDVAGGAAFIQGLSLNNNSLWYIDEVALTMKEINSMTSPMREIKQYLLTMYSGQSITRAVKGKDGLDEIKIEDPCLTIFGLNTPESFIKNISEDSMLDGFSQRFNYFHADDPLEEYEDYPLYDLNGLTEDIKEALAPILSLELHNEYKASEEAIKEHSDYFRISHKHLKGNESFHRRLTFNLWRYAIILHALEGKESDTIDKQDVINASKIVDMNIVDLKYLLLKYNFSDIYNKVLAVEELRKRFGSKLNTRIILQYRKNIKGAREAQEILNLVTQYNHQNDDEDVAPFGLDEKGKPLAPYGYTKKGTIKLKRGGGRPKKVAKEE